MSVCVRADTNKPATTNYHMNIVDSLCCLNLINIIDISHCFSIIYYHFAEASTSSDHRPGYSLPLEDKHPIDFTC